MAKNGETTTYQLTKAVGGTKTLAAILDNSKAAIAEVLPKHLTPERMAKMAMIAVNREPKLLKCTGTSVLRAVMMASELGLDCSGTLGQGYLIPYKETCQFIAGYRGYIDLARRSDQIANFNVQLVYKPEVQKGGFVYDKAKGEIVKHEADPYYEPNDKDIVGAYMVTTFNNGTNQVEYMTIGQIRAIMRASPGARKQDSPWHKHFGEMARKTVVRRAMKFLPLATEDQRMARLIQHDNEVDGIDLPGAGRTVDLTPGEYDSEPGTSRADRLAETLEKEKEELPKEPEPTPEQQEKKKAVTDKARSMLADQWQAAVDALGDKKGEEIAGKIVAQVTGGGELDFEGDGLGVLTKAVDQLEAEVKAAE